MFPLTLLGTFVLLFSIFVYRSYARPRSDLVVSMAVLGGLVFVAAAVIEVFVAWLMLRAWKPAAQERMVFEAERGFARAPEIPRLNTFPWIEAKPTVEFPRGLRWVDDRFEAVHRCQGGQVGVRIHVDDGFGLARSSRGFVLDLPVRVAPYLGQLDRSAELKNWARGEGLHHPRGKPSGDPIDVRPYVRGDPIRRVLWKVYARTGELMVRAPEKALDEKRTVHAFLVAGSADDEASAAAAWVSVWRGYFGPDWRFGASGQPAVKAEREGALDAIANSRGASLGDGLERFLSSAEGAVAIVLFVPGGAGPWLEPVLAQVRRHAGSVTAVVATDEGMPDEVQVQLQRAGAAVISVTRSRKEAA